MPSRTWISLPTARASSSWMAGTARSTNGRAPRMKAMLRATADGRTPRAHGEARRAHGGDARRRSRPRGGRRAQGAARPRSRPAGVSRERRRSRRREPRLSRTGGARARGAAHRQGPAAARTIAGDSARGHGRERWLGMPAEQRDQARERFQHLQSLPPEQRHALRSRWEKFQSLPPQEQAKVRENFHKFKQLPPERRQMLREQWHNASPAQRQEMIHQAREQRQKREGERAPVERPAQAPHPPHR